MLNSLKLWLLEQKLRLQSGKYDAYLNQVRQQDAVRNVPLRVRIAAVLLQEPKFSRMRSWAEFQRHKNMKNE